jgi:hypothetical protein
MAILGFGTSLAELTPEGVYSSSYFSSTTLTKGPYVAEGIQLSPSAPQPGELGALVLPFTAAADFWVSYYGMQNNPLVGTGDGTIMEIRGNDKELFRWKGLDGSYGIEYHNDASYQLSGTRTQDFPISVAVRYDFHVVIHDTVGTLTMHINGAEVTVATFSGDTLLRGESVADTVMFGSDLVPAALNRISAVFVSDTDSRLIHYDQKALDGAGAETDWSGAYTDIDEQGIDFTDFIQGAANADKATYTFAALDTTFNDAAYTPIGLGVSARGVKGATGPANLQLAARENITNGFSGNKALGDIWSMHQHMFTQNPDTAAAWTFAELDAAQVGVQAIT